MDLTFGPPLSQSGRLLQLTTPPGEHQLHAPRMHWVERHRSRAPIPSAWWCKTPNTISKNSSASPLAWPFSAMTVLPRSATGWLKACVIWAMTTACITGNWFCAVV